jgi:hypothetical protein
MILAGANKDLVRENLSFKKESESVISASPKIGLFRGAKKSLKALSSRIQELL